MSTTSLLALYFVAWWLTLFAVLPLRIRSQHEEGAVEDGTEPGAPVLPRMGWKVIITTVAAVPVTAALWALIRYID